MMSLWLEFTIQPQILILLTKLALHIYCAQWRIRITLDERCQLLKKRKLQIYRKKTIKSFHETNSKELKKIFPILSLPLTKEKRHFTFCLVFHNLPSFPIDHLTRMLHKRWHEIFTEKEHVSDGFSNSD